jgi:hypothetical protein
VIEAMSDNCSQKTAGDYELSQRRKTLPTWQVTKDGAGSNAGVILKRNDEPEGTSDLPRQERTGKGPLRILMIIAGTLFVRLGDGARRCQSQNHGFVEDHEPR